MLHAIELTESDGEGTLLELRGDLDVFSLPEMSAALDRVAGLRRPALVDLSGVTFLDVRSAHELMVRSWLHGHHVAFVNPSWQVLASVGACGFGERARFGPAENQTEAAAFPGLPEPA
ncbi:MAG: STAS domain-containing protein [Rubrobacteraceae bacterium]|nr:hypothetical protein [Rubrobacter sp.]